MRVFAGIAATAILIAACGGPAAVSTPTPTASPTPTPIPTVANTFKAELKAANENPPITITLTGGAVTFSRTNSAADPALITAIMANPAGYYVNFHSTAHGGGVIRGQLSKA